MTALLAAGALSVLPVAAPPSFAAGEDCAPGNPQFTPETPSALGVLQSQKAWSRGTGGGVLVAVVDSGIDATNPHLQGAVVGGRDFVFDGEDPRGMTDVNGHGTAIAGQIAAREIPQSGVVGLAPSVDLLSVRVFRGTDSQSVDAGFGPTTARMSEGIRFAADSHAVVINVSMSDFAASPDLEAAVAYAESLGSLVVASAGNRGTTEDVSDSPRYPAAYAGALAVSATDARGLVTDDSIHGSHVEVAAPGSQILTVATGAGDCVYAQEAPSSSFATAYVSAAAALVAAAHPDETPAQWQYRLMATGIRSNPDARDDLSGWGVVQPYNAINLVPGADTRGPVSPAGTSGAGVLVPAVATVSPDHTESPFIVTQAMTLIVIVVALTLFGTIAVIIVLRRRRGTVPTTEGEPARHGLLGS
ncbi:type VII secretion-associated serine protease mycosin [Conyzicola nivalis]|uniref:Type VII secretion-associated serine protease n=1 Tax=Conyzicola nivalis TaxID=1477021 RepID=A0A916SPU6_9MICO|nr:type VII secretion-associated serine protease [Conyzicola nivalis]